MAPAPKLLYRIDRSRIMRFALVSWTTAVDAVDATIRVTRYVIPNNVNNKVETRSSLGGKAVRLGKESKDI